MPRRARLELPGVPMHLVQRGVNRGAVFVDDVDRWHYLRLLHRVAADGAVRIHAYVLMDNHVHLLVSSPEAGAVSSALHLIGQCHAQAFNRRHRRTGPLWEGRFKSCLVDSDGYLLTVYRYIELNPLRAGMTDQPLRYRWSSVRGNLGGLDDPVLTPHESFNALGSDPKERREAYRRWLLEGVTDKELLAIRRHLAQERALGDPRFQLMVERTLGRPVALRSRGRQPAREGDAGRGRAGRGRG